MMHKNEAEQFEVLFEGLEDIIGTNLPDPCMLEYYRRLKDREILWNCDISDCTIDISMYIMKWNKEDKGLPINERKPIKIFINSNGGDVNPVMHIVDIISISKTPVYTIGLGKIFSSGGILFVAGHKRFVFENTSCLIHDGSTIMGGDNGKVIDNFVETKRILDRIREYFIANTKITPNEFDEHSRKDWYITAEEMVKYGIADCIVKDLDIIL